MSRKSEYNLQYWSAMIQDRLESGMTVKEWCREKGTTKYAYYYWLEKLREEHYDEAVQGIKGTRGAAGNNALVPPAPVGGEDGNKFVEIRAPGAIIANAGNVAPPGRVPAAVLQCGKVRIEVYEDTTAGVMERLVRVLNNAEA